MKTNQLIESQKLKLEQRKASIAAEEARIRIKEQKQRIKQLIELGKLVIKAGIDHLLPETLYGAFISIKNSLDAEKNEGVLKQWSELGREAMINAANEIPVTILVFDADPGKDARAILRQEGMKWHHIRKEAYGRINDLIKLKSLLGDIRYKVETIQQSSE